MISSTPSNGGWLTRLVMADGRRYGAWTQDRCEGFEWAIDLETTLTPLPRRS